MNINFKQRTLKLALVSAFALGASAMGVNAYAATATTDATATVIAPITIARTADLVFGKFASNTGGAGGTVVIAAGGGRSKTGDVALVAATAGNAASFNLTGESGASYVITLPADGIVTISGGVGTTPMAVNGFTSSATGTLAAGAETVTVGGTLTVAAVQTAGAYSGAFAVTVEYN